MLFGVKSGVVRFFHKLKRNLLVITSIALGYLCFSLAYALQIVASIVDMRAFCEKSAGVCSRYRYKKQACSS